HGAPAPGRVVDVLPQGQPVPVVQPGAGENVEVTLGKRKASQEDFRDRRPTVQADQIETENGGAHQAVHAPSLQPVRSGVRPPIGQDDYAPELRVSADGATYSP